MDCLCFHPHGIENSSTYPAQLRSALPTFYLGMEKESSFSNTILTFFYFWKTRWQMNNIGPEHNILLAEYYRTDVYSFYMAKILFQALF